MTKQTAMEWSLAPCRVLAINPFDGGSHRSFLQGLIAQSRHQWTVLGGKPVHWKWRMRSSPLPIAESTRIHVDRHGYPDVVFCTDMLDLPTWRGLLNDPAFAAIPVLIYFHESQWTYPTSPHSPVDHHYGYTNLLSAIAAEACVFNSRFHRDTFLEASERFVRRMPDSKSAHDWNQLKLKCHVIAPGIDLRDTAWSRTHQANDAVRETLKAPLPTRSKVIGWVSRWESDKRPDRFANMLRDLARQDQNFQLILLGARTGISGRSPCEALEKIRRDHGDRILYDGFAPTAPEYWHWLSKMDFVVSTADHEFFGIAICEAMHAGVIPVVPNRLSYPELVPPDCLYESSEEAIAMLCKSEDTRQSLTAACRACANRFDRKQTARMIDERVDRLIVNHRIGRT